MSVVEAVMRDIEGLGPDAADSGLAATALAMAEAIDAGGSRTSLAICGKELRECMRELRALAPPKVQEDRVDEIAKRRERRISSTAG